MTGRAETAGLTRRERAKEETRARVLSAARTMFAEAGYEAATLRGIGAAAGMSTGAVFQSYPDKVALYRAAVGHGPVSPELGAKLLWALDALLATMTEVSGNGPGHVLDADALATASNVMLRARSELGIAP